MSTEAALIVIFPVSGVLLVRSDPEHGSLTVTFIKAPLSLIIVAGLVSHLPVATLHTSLPLSFVDGAVSVTKDAIPMTESAEPLTLVDDAFLGVSVGAAAMSKTVNDLALIIGAISPVIAAVSCDLVLSELALVLGAIVPQEFALAMQKTVLHFTLEGVALPELAGALSMIDLAYLNKKRRLVSFHKVLGPRIRSKRLPVHSSRSL
jgi:hypothetical protein